MHELVWLVLSNGQFTLRNGANLFASENTVFRTLVGAGAATVALLYEGTKPASDDTQRSPEELAVPLLEELLAEDAGEISDKAGLRTIAFIQPINLDEMCPADTQSTLRTLLLPTCDAPESSDFVPDVSNPLPAPFPDLDTQPYIIPTNSTVSDNHTIDYTDPLILAPFILSFVIVCAFIFLARRTLYSYLRRIAQAVASEATDPPISSTIPDALTPAALRPLGSTAVADKEVVVPLVNISEELKDTKASSPPTYDASSCDGEVAMLPSVPVDDMKITLEKDGTAEEINHSGGEDLPVLSAPPASAEDLAHVAPSEAAQPARVLDEQPALNDTVSSDKKVDEYAPAQDRIARPDVPKDVALPGEADMPVSLAVDDAPMLLIEAPARQRTRDKTPGLPVDASVVVRNEEQSAPPTTMQMIARPRRLATLPRIVACEDPQADEENVPANGEGILPDGPDALGIARPLLVGSLPSEHNDRPGMVFFEHTYLDKKGTAHGWRALIGTWDYHPFDHRRYLFELLVLICRVFLAAQRGTRAVVVVFRMHSVEQRDSRPAQCWLLVDLRRIEVGQRGLFAQEHSVSLATDKPRREVEPPVGRALLVNLALHGDVASPLSSAYMPALEVSVVFGLQRLALASLRVISLEAGPAEDIADVEDTDAEKDTEAEDANGEQDIDNKEDDNGEEDANGEEDVGDQTEAAPLQAPMEHVPMQQGEDAQMANDAVGEEAAPVRRAPRPLRLLHRRAATAPVGDRVHDHPNGDPADEVPRVQNRGGEPRPPEEPLITPANSEEELQLVATIQNIIPRTPADLRRIRDVFGAVARFRGRKNAERGDDAGGERAAAPDPQVPLDGDLDVEGRADERTQPTDAVLPTDDAAGVHPRPVVPAGDEALEPIRENPQPAVAGVRDGTADAEEDAGAGETAAPINQTAPAEALQDDVQAERIALDELEVLGPAARVAPQPTAVTPLGVGAARLPFADVTNRPSLTRSRTMTNPKPLVRPPWRI